MAGDNAALRSSMALTVVFSLASTIFLTLIIVPARYLIANKAKAKLKAINRKSKN